jgi:hypothetical protein
MIESVLCFDVPRKSSFKADETDKTLLKPPQPWIKYDKDLERRYLCNIMPLDAVRPRVIIWHKSLLLGVNPVHIAYYIS